MKAPIEPSEALVPFRQRIGCTIREACVAAGIGPTLLYALIADGTIETKKIGRRRVVAVKSLLHLIEGDASGDVASK